MIEIWKAIPEYEEHYEVSSYGRVRSKNRTIKAKNRMLPIHGRILKVGIAKNGYPLVSLWMNNRGKSVYVHSLVLAIFFNKPEWAETCNHKNYNRTDNRIENIEWVTYSQNNFHSYKSGRHKNLKENRNGRGRNEKVSTIIP